MAYIRPVSPTSIALITSVEKKVHISPSSNIWRGSYISLLEKKANQQYEKISLSINQCWNSLNLINVQFLTNALGNYVWLTEKWSGLMKLKLFWRRSKTNSLSWRSKLRLEGENKEYNGTLPPSFCIQKIYISVIVYFESFLCVKFWLHYTTSTDKT